MLTLFPLVKYTHRISHVFRTSYSITLETSCFYSKLSPLKFILLFAMLHVLGGRDNFDNTRLQPVPTTLHVVQLVCSVMKPCSQVLCSVDEYTNTRQDTQVCHNDHCH